MRVPFLSSGSGPSRYVVRFPRILPEERAKRGTTPHMNPRGLVKWTSRSSQLRAPQSGIFPDAASQGLFRAVPVNPIQLVVRLLRKYVGTIIICLGVSTSLILLYAARQPRLYRATANIAIYRESEGAVPVIKSFGSMMGDADDYSVSLETQIRVLQSRSLALGVVRKLKLEQNSKFLASGKKEIADIKRLSSDNSPQYASETVATNLILAALSVTPIKNTRVVEVSFTGADRYLNSKIVNALVDDFIEDSIRSRYEASNRAARFLSGQLNELRAKVEESQQRLVAYEREHNIVMVDDKQSVTTSKLDELNKQLLAAEEDSIEKEAAYQTITAGNLDRFADIQSGEALQSLRLREAELKTEYAQATTMYGPNHPRVVELTNRMQAMDSSVQAEVTRLRGRAQDEYRIAVRREQKMRAAFEGQKAEVNRLNESAIQYGLLKREFESNRQLYDGLQERMKEAGVAAGLRSSNIRLIDSAQSSIFPVSPNLPRSGYIGLFLGLLASAAVIAVREGMNRALRDPAEVESFTAMPSLAIIPQHRQMTRSPARADRTLEEVICVAQPASAIAEAYRALATSILLASADLKMLLVTSPLPSEGKTTTAVNAAVVIAQQGKRVLLVDADLRNPTLHEAFGIPSEPGLSALLLERTTGIEAIRSCELVPNLSLIPAGSVQERPAELLGSSTMRALLGKWREQYDYVIIDTPPILAVTDAVRLSSQSDSVLLVIRSGCTTREALARSCDVLNQASVPVLGIVVNGVNSRAAGPYYYGYYHELMKKYYREVPRA